MDDKSTVRVSAGCPHPLGPSVISTKMKQNSKEYQSVNLAVLSHVRITLCLFAPLHDEETNFIRDVWQKVPFAGSTGTVQHVRLDDMPRGTAYAIAVSESTGGHRLLTDVYAPCVESGGSQQWMQIPGEGFNISSTSVEINDVSNTNPVQNVRNFLYSFRTLRDLGVDTLFRPARFEVDCYAFDWGGHDKRPEVRDEHLIVYEAHARALGADGSLEGAAERAEYLRWLGVTAVQLMPVFEFAEVEMRAIGGETQILRKEPLKMENEQNKNGANRSQAYVPASEKRRENHWGYAPLSFFAPMNRYGRAPVSGGPRALKTFVRAMHAQGILVILDVVYNHTSNVSCAWHFLGVQHEYYLNSAHSSESSSNTHQHLTKQRNSPKFKHSNFSACGNTISANSPRGQDLIVRSLRHFVNEYHVDGFRLDCAGVLCRGIDGIPMKRPPVLDCIAEDDVLRNVKLIVEGWDAGDQIGSPNFLFGSFPHGDLFREWNPVWRDAVRSFFKPPSLSTDKTTSSQTARITAVVKAADERRHMFRQALCGFPELYGENGRLKGVNFVACHDGFSMIDVVSFSRRVNKDGYDEISFNCGFEGNDFFNDKTPDGVSTAGEVLEFKERVLQLRARQLRNFVMALALSRGVPMITQGDEIEFSKQGNSNSYNDPDFYAATLPPDMQLYVDRVALVQFVHFMFKWRGLNGLDFNDETSWVDAMGRPISISNTSPQNNFDNGDEDIEKTGRKDETLGLDSNSLTEGDKFEMPRLGDIHDEEEDVVKESIEDSDLVAFVRPCLKTLSSQSDRVVEAVFVAFNNGKKDLDICIPDVGYTAQWTFQVDTFSATWKQDTRYKWKSNENIILHAQSAILFTGKIV